MRTSTGERKQTKLKTFEMATKKAAEHTLYHLSPKGFWKKFRDAVVVNKEISSGLPLPDKNRYPQPGSRLEKYSTPATRGELFVHWPIVILLLVSYGSKRTGVALGLCYHLILEDWSSAYVRR